MLDVEGDVVFDDVGLVVEFDVVGVEVFWKPDSVSTTTTTY